MDNATYGMLVSFPDQSEAFVLGFEAGQCWQRLEAGDHSGQVIHTANEEVIRRIGRHFGLDAVAIGTGVPGWSVVTFERCRPKLSVVQQQPPSGKQE